MCTNRTCGGLDCVCCHGESARYHGWCDECEFACDDGFECTAEPGSEDCPMKELVDDAKAEAYGADKDQGRGEVS